MRRDFIEEGSRRAPVRDEADVLVCGGGPAGIAAAVAAARAGAKTWLIESHGCLGGVWTAGLLAWVFEMDKQGLAMEIGRRLDAMDARSGSQYYSYGYDVEAMKLLCEELCAESGVQVRLHTRVSAAKKDASGKLQAIFAESKSGREAWKAKVFVDCSGDGDLGAQAGCGFDVGGPEGEIQPCTLMALVAVKDVARIADAVSFYEGRREHNWKNFAAELESAGVSPSYGHPTMFHIKGNICGLMVNHEYGCPATDADALTKATVNARAEINKTVKALRALGGKWDSLQLVASAEQIGIRDGRRLHGLYTLKREDLLNGAPFPDGVCANTFNIDIHSHDPAKDKSLRLEKVKPYQIPYRSLVAKDAENLLMAGRCVSGDWFAHASYRVVGSAVAMGEAAGAAAALSTASGKPPRELEWSQVEAAVKKTRRAS